MNFRNIFYFLTFTLLLFNCSNDSNDDLIGTPDPDPIAKVTYVADVKPIIDGNCISCHGNPTTQGAPFSLTTYTQVSSRVNNIINRINNSSSPMPPTGLMPQNLRDLVQLWKDDGLLEN